MDAREVMTPAEAAEFLQVHIKTVHKWIESGELRSSRLGPRSTRILKADLMQFLEAKASGPPASAKPAATGPAAERDASPARDAIAASRLIPTRSVKKKLPQ